MDDNTIEISERNISIRNVNSLENWNVGILGSHNCVFAQFHHSIIPTFHFNINDLIDT